MLPLGGGPDLDVPVDALWLHTARQDTARASGRARIAAAGERGRGAARIRAPLRLDVQPRRRSALRVDRTGALSRHRRGRRHLHREGLPRQQLRARAVWGGPRGGPAADRAACAPRRRRGGALLRLLAALRSGPRPRPVPPALPRRPLDRPVVRRADAHRPSHAPRRPRPAHREGVRPLPRRRAVGDLPPDRAAVGGDARGARESPRGIRVAADGGGRHAKHDEGRWRTRRSSRATRGIRS